MSEKKFLIWLTGFIGELRESSFNKVKGDRNFVEIKKKIIRN